MLEVCDGCRPISNKSYASSFSLLKEESQGVIDLPPKNKKQDHLVGAME